LEAKERNDKEREIEREVIMMKQQNETVEREAAVSLDQASIDGAVEAKAAKTAKASEAARVKKASQATRATST